MRVLLIEDDAMTRDLWTLLLEQEGYQVTGAESGERALQLLQEGRMRELPAPDVVLTDIQMPGIAGSALAAALRAACRQKTDDQERTLLLAMSASEPRRTVLKGYDGFLLKPFTMEALGRALSGAGQRAENGAASPQPRLGGTETMVLDEVVYSRLLETMPEEKLRELYAFCMGDTRMRVQRMRVAAELRHDEVFRRTAHEIKGACGMIGATELRGMAALLEESGLSNGVGEALANLNRFMMACERLEGMLGRRWVAS
jgi:CheY-like chemotaxis protein/HPt (histidine-containing phosphotransfer) domain-containing protein